MAFEDAGGVSPKYWHILARRHIESLGISHEARVLEVGCGNDSMSSWMAEHIAPDGQVVALDLDLSLVDNLRASGVEFRQGDILRRFERLRMQQLESERQAEHLFQILLYRAFSPPT